LILCHLYSKMNSKLKKYIAGLQPEMIAEERKEVLQPLIDYIQPKTEKGEEVNLNFICTHNSRRSQFAQVWAATAVLYYQKGKINCFSGGTEVTACNERTVTALEEVGFEVTSDFSQEENPIYAVNPSKEKNITVFSKLCNDLQYIKTPFAALMTCSNAEQNCPFIPEAEIRIPVKYEDPKAFDDTDKEVKMYGKRCKQIAEEMFYVFSKIK
jgi:arsenate reductase